MASHYDGVIDLAVDLTDLDHKIMTVHETLPVKPGRLTLLYPQWIPGSHSPIGNVAMLTGLHLHANGTELRWRRDPVNVFAFHVEVPAGARSLDIEFQFVSPLQSSQGRVVMTRDIAHLQFHSVVLYPDGVRADGIQVRPTVRLPEGWQQASGLEPAEPAAPSTPAKSGAAGPVSIAFKPVDLATLIDSPLMAGRYFRRYALNPSPTVSAAGATGKADGVNPGSAAPVFFDAFTEREDQLNASDKVLAAHRALVSEAASLFGPPPYAHYDFLMALTEGIGNIGREHFQSTEIVETPTYFADVLTSSNHSGVVPHEYAHAWIGKYRRPADQFTANYSEPLRNSLLWVYEGQTTYYGDVLAARSGLRSMDTARDRLALSIASVGERRGRQWRDLQDTVNDELVSPRSLPRNWPNWQRQLDYYGEGALVWLGVDARIRFLTGEKRSLDDFAAAFYANADKSLRKPLAYTFEDVVAALDRVAHADWATLLRARLEAHDDRGLNDDLALTGWRLVYNKTPNPVSVIALKESGDCDAGHSLGMTVSKSDAIGGMTWQGPAFQAGLVPGTTILAVNGRVYKCSELTDAIAAAEGKTTPIELIVKRENRIWVVPVAYNGGVRHPHLERIAGMPDRLTPILAARVTQTASGTAAPENKTQNEIKAGEKPNGEKQSADQPGAAAAPVGPVSPVTPVAPAAPVTSPVPEAAAPGTQR